MKRIAELRPVLPRPTAVGDPSNRGPVHIPSSGSAHAHPQRHHRSGQAPYELAYGMVHQQHMPCRQSYIPATHSNFAFSSSSNDQGYTEQLQIMGLNPDSWNPNSESIGLGDLPFPSLCGCGDDCNCPGCLHHNRATSIPMSSAFASCTNPGVCATCLDCTIMSLPPSALDDTALSIPNAQNEPVAEWLRQVSAAEFSSVGPSGHMSLQQSINDGFGQQWNTPDMDQSPPFVPPTFHYGSASMPDMTPFSTTGDGGPPRTFSSDPHHHRSHHHRSHSSIDPRVLPGMTSNHELRFLDPLRSRSPSTSSQSSSHEGHGNGLPLSYTPNGRQQGMFINPQGVRSASQLNAPASRPGIHRGST
jgi:hypothetical protein